MNSHVSVRSVKKNPFILVANWKMNGSRKMSLDFLQGLASALQENPQNYDALWFVLCLPSTLLIPCSDLLEKLDLPISLGAQNLYWENKGPFTGELSSSLLRDAGAQATLIGHSEQRHGYLHETNQTVHKKANAALKGGLMPIVCVGEDASVREKKAHESYISHQVDESIPCYDILQSLPRGNLVLPKFLIAYEPCWAIGSGRIPTEQDRDLMTEIISERLRIHYKEERVHCGILYGGSVTPENITSICTPSLTGVLVGGASLVLKDFLTIARSCSAVR
jgi:triosephosphate isomerase